MSPSGPVCYNSVCERSSYAPQLTRTSLGSGYLRQNSSEGMMFSRRLVTLATLLVTAQATRLAAQGPNLEDSVRALESQRAQALLKADTVALSQLLADDFVEISRLGTLRTKAD